MITTSRPAVDLDLVSRIPLFEGLSAESLSSIAACLQPLEVPAGGVVFREGDDGDDMYMVAAGRVRIVSDVETEKVVFADLGPGEFFGEMSLLTGAPRSAGAVAGTAVELWRLHRAAFESIQRDHTEIALGISRILGERVRRGNSQRFQNEAFTLLALTPERSEVTIGRLPENDLVVDDPQVGAVHARVVNEGGRWVIHDLGSEAGTYVNRERITSIPLHDGDEVLIGTNKIYLDGLTVKGFVRPGGVRIDVMDLTRTLPGGKRVLDGVSLSIQPGEFVGIVGASGAGKTSLLHALNAFAPATGGSITYNGVELYQNLALFRPVLGYVPQDDIVHAELTVERTLYYGAKLRLPADTRPEEMQARVDEVLAAVGLTQHRKTQVRRLSGGQRKRVSIALELLARPRALYLDEPTSGLDPALEGRMMALFRDLTEGGATVVVSTHATQSLRLCDRVAWMAPGGRLVFFGSPGEALRHFGVQDFSEIYELLETPEAVDQWMAAFLESPAHRVNVRERLDSQQPATAAPRAAGDPLPEGASVRRGGPLRQLLWLTLRYAEVLRHDTVTVALLLLQAPAIGLSLLLLFSRHIFALDTAAGGDAIRAVVALHIVTASAIFLGASNSAREITKESAIYRRERLVNLGVVPYMASKALVLSALCLFQAATLVAVFAAWVNLPGPQLTLYGQLVAAVFLTELAGLSMGLLVSTLASNSDRATVAVPLLLIPQLIFSGALVPLSGMRLPGRILSEFMISKWALQLAGGLSRVGERFVAQLPPSFADPYRSEMSAGWPAWVVLGAFAAAMLAAAALVQKRKDAL